MGAGFEVRLGVSQAVPGEPASHVMTRGVILWHVHGLTYEVGDCVASKKGAADGTFGRI